MVIYIKYSVVEKWLPRTVSYTVRQLFDSALRYHYTIVSLETDLASL
jgi:hypothetical protein